MEAAVRQLIEKILEVLRFQVAFPVQHAGPLPAPPPSVTPVFLTLLSRMRCLELTQRDVTSTLQRESKSTTQREESE